jgi:hypothetical protein
MLCIKHCTFSTLDTSIKWMHPSIHYTLHYRDASTVNIVTNVLSSCISTFMNSTLSCYCSRIVYCQLFNPGAYCMTMIIAMGYYLVSNLGVRILNIPYTITHLVSH